MTGICEGSFRIDTRRGTQHVPLSVEDADFLAALVVPHAAWYIIPVAAFAPAKHLALFPQTPASRGRWERFRDAWQLLRRQRPWRP